MTKFTVLAFGDSVMWGQGLADSQKFHNLAARRIADALGIASRDLKILNYAHSGAVIDDQDAGPPLDITLSDWQEVPHSTPTILQQVTTSEVSTDVDLVLINGGINDVDFQTIINPFQLSEEALEEAIQTNCYAKMKNLIHTVRARFSRAVIIIVGYFPILSPHSEKAIIPLVASILGDFGGSAPLIIPLVARAAFRSHYFHRRQLSWLRKAVTELQGDPASRDPGVYFAHPAFGPRNSVGAPEPLLFEPQTPSGVDDPEELWEWFVHNVIPGIAILRSNDPMFSRRHRMCDKLYDNPSLDLVQCTLASVGHPTSQGAVRYADTITEIYLKNRQLHVRSNLSRLLKGSPDLSLRRAMERYHLSNSSVRGFLQNMTVDSIDVTIKTSDKPLSGTDDDIFLRVNGSREWRLNYSPFEGDLTDDFETGSLGVFTVDPADGDPKKRLHLGEIQEISLVKRNASGSVAPDWRPESIRVALNGREVLYTGIDRELTVSNPVWTASDYPQRI